MAELFGDLDIERILEEEETDDVACASSMSTEGQCTGSSTVQLLTKDILRNVCSAMATDQCLPEEYRQPFERICDSDLDHFSFLNGCIVPKGIFPTASAEKSWGKFHQACKDHAAATGGKLGLDMGSCFLLCLRLFRQLVDINYCDTKASSADRQETQDVSADERGILHYVAGYIMRALKKKVQVGQQQQEKLEVLECFIDNEHDQGPEQQKESLTELYDRGGLTYVKPAVVRLFIMMECTFRTYYTSSQIYTANTFKEKCTHTSIAQLFYELCYDSLAEEAVKEFVFNLMLELFFRVRIHHKCRKVMDLHRNVKQISEKQKGIRKSLKSGKPQV